MTRIVALATAISEIAAACKHQATGAPAPFVFMVGAGISSPEVPLAAEIMSRCRTRLRELPWVEPADPLTAYSRLVGTAFPHAAQRRDFFLDLLRDCPISYAAQRLAHILSAPPYHRVASVVLTPNFDTFLHRALDLFGVPHVLCDHPSTSIRCDLEREGHIQLIHLHGSLPFYDCLNLKAELEGGAQYANSTVASMAHLLDAALRSRSPLVVGYGGWEGDAFMTALKRRLTAAPLPFNLYWFCHRASDVRQLPQWLLTHASVTLVVPEGRSAVHDAAMTSAPPTHRDEPSAVLEASRIFDEIVRACAIAPPSLLEDPLSFLEQRFSREIATSVGVPGADDPYSLNEVVRRIQAARRCVDDADGPGVDPAADTTRAIAIALRRADFKSVLKEARNLANQRVDASKRADIARLLLALSRHTHLDDERAAALDTAEQLLFADAGTLRAEDQQSALLGQRVLFAKAMALVQRDRSQALSLLERSILTADTTVPDSHLLRIQAMTNSGLILAELGRLAEAEQELEQTLREAAELPEPPVALAFRVKVGLARCTLHRGDLEQGLLAIDSALGELPESVDEDTAIARIGAIRLKAEQLHAYGRTAAAIETVMVSLQQLDVIKDGPGVFAAVFELLRFLARRLAESGSPTEALTLLDAVTQHPHSRTSPEGIRVRAASYTDKIAILLKNAQYEAAADVAGLAIRELTTEPDPYVREGLIFLRHRQSNALRRLRRLDEAIAVLEPILADDTSVSLNVSLDVLSGALRELADLYDLRERPDKALTTNIRLIELLEGTQLFLRRAQAMSRAALCYLKLERYENAMTMADRCARTALALEGVEARRLAVTALLQKSDALLAMRRLELASKTHREILAQFAEDGDVAVQVSRQCAVIAQSTVLLCLGRNDEARQTVRAAVAVLEAIGGKSADDAIGRALSEEARLCEVLGNLDGAVGAYEQIVSLFRSGRNLVLEDVLKALNNRANLLCVQGLFEEALQSYEEALRRAEESDLWRESVYSLGLENGRVNALRALKRESEAKAAGREAVRRFGDSDSPQIQALLEVLKATIDRLAP